MFEKTGNNSSLYQKKLLKKAFFRLIRGAAAIVLSQNRANACEFLTLCHGEIIAR